MTATMLSTGDRPPRIYRADDAPAGVLAGQTVGVLGYGNLGRSVALNLRDSGVTVRVGNRQDEYATLARADGFDVVPLAVAASCSIVFVLLPDEAIPSVFAQEVAPALRPGGAIAFASGYCLAFQLIRPPDTVDVLLVAPRIPGGLARTRYLAGEGFWAFVGVEADRTGSAERRMLGLAAALGALRAGALEMSAADEATIDLFVEQTVGVLLGAALMIGFEIGTEIGIRPEALVLEMYMSGEMETVFRSFRERGFLAATEEHGTTALFGGLVRTLELDRESIAETFRATVKDIVTGGFARRFQDDAARGGSLLEGARMMARGPSPITAAEAALRRRVQPTA
jgi:ketol-acid reductoisomerase